MVKIARDDLRDGAVIALLQDHHREMHLYSPAASIHALDETQFFDESLTFWSAWHANRIVACGALKALTKHEGEIKAMRTAGHFLRRGAAEVILNQILAEASYRRYARLYLETGAHAFFQPAVCLYQKFGFNECGPFGAYRADPHSRFFCKAF